MIMKFKQKFEFLEYCWNEMMNKVIQCKVYSVKKTGSDWHGNIDKTVHSGRMKIATWTSKIG
jgi:hypothetical protein